MTPSSEGPVYIGLMSGTSLDGISAAAVRFREDAHGRFDPRLLSTVNTAYTSAQRARLERALTGGTPAEYCQLGFDLGDWLSSAAVLVIAEAGIARDEIRAIGSHGQTIWHAPRAATWQIGESAVIAERTGIEVVSDFRVADVAAGGEGAPLVPVADALLFSAPSHWRALQNLGGIGNLTIVPPGGDLSGVRGFDTGPGVGVIDGVVRALTPSLPYDVDGALSAAGVPLESVVEALLDAPFFREAPPKSTGRELFDAGYVASLIDSCRIHEPDASTPDIVATATALTARSIADAVRRFVPEPIVEVLISGGGAKNPALARMIATALEGIIVRRFDDVYFDGEAKEAVAFALLAHLHVTGRTGNIPRVTGAKGFRILGKRTPPVEWVRGATN